jgi:secreted Zn-dependent insulinase-like peptidase
MYFFFFNKKKFKQDDIFNKPKIISYINIKIKDTYLSPKNYIYSRLYLNLVNDSLEKVFF